MTTQDRNWYFEVQGGAEVGSPRRRPPRRTGALWRLLQIIGEACGRARRDDDTMPTHAWSCISCGDCNVADAETCIQCGCTARVTAKQVEAFRARHAARGGQLRGEAALSATSDLSALEVFGPFAALMLGVWPWGGRASHLRPTPSFEPTATGKPASATQ